MLCWSQLKILLVSRAGGRSAKAAPFWTRAWWAREREETKTVGRGPMWRVTMGPCLEWRERRMGSSSVKDLRSHRRFPMRGKVRGPGGSLGPAEEGEERRPRRGLMRAARQRVMTMTNQSAMEG
ncbi:hypothetical protein CRG98_041870 [Punica granatum]|uniref:Secreted protein n=1 Tax=Punica granatum TaxID=22663 RepID=A0A2I0I1R2_PUNGR|nr:hypothetical protein CRG98_041870 [Punica granatum]